MSSTCMSSTHDLATQKVFELLGQQVPLVYEDPYLHLAMPLCDQARPPWEEGLGTMKAS